MFNLARALARLVALSAFAVLLVGPAFAATSAARAAGTGGGWSRVTPKNTDITADIGLARGSDGVLHALWLAGDSPKQRIMDTPISAKGAVGRALTVTGGWFGANVPDAVATPRGLFVLWNGLPRGDGTLEPGVYESSHPLKGGRWTAPRKAASTGVGETEDVPDTAGQGPGGHPWAAFTLTDELGVDPTTGTKVQVIPPSKCCVYAPGLADDGASAAMWVTYFSLISHHEGIFAQKLTSTGRPSGKARLLPGSETKGSIVTPDQRVGTVARGAGRAGVYVAYGSGYPTLNRVDVVRIGARTPRVLARTGQFSEFMDVTIAQGAAGRVWVAWVLVASGVPQLFVTESSPGVTGFAKATKVPLPKGTATVWKVYLNGHGNGVDVLALTSTAAVRSAAYWSRVVTRKR